MKPASQTVIGGCYAAAAFSAWGVLPLYFRLLDHISPLEMVAHRIVWSMVLLAGLISFFASWSPIRAALRSRRTLLMLLGSTIFICINWLVFIWAVEQERVVEVSMGYYINPLVNVVLGILVLRERLSPWQIAAVGLATLGVGILAFRTGGVPWPALALACSFGIYGLIRKMTTLGSMDGLFLETALVAPLALGFLLFIGWKGSGHFASYGLGTDLQLIALGVITALPLIWFASGARRLSYAAVGFFQYLAPTGHFLLAVFVFGEAFTRTHLLTFTCIWAALAIFSADSLLRHRRRSRRRAAEAALATPDS